MKWNNKKWIRIYIKKWNTCFLWWVCWGTWQVRQQTRHSRQNKNSILLLIPAFPFPFPVAFLIREGVKVGFVSYYQGGGKGKIHNMFKCFLSYRYIMVLVFLFLFPFLCFSLSTRVKLGSFHTVKGTGKGQGRCVIGSNAYSVINKSVLIFLFLFPLPSPSLSAGVKSLFNTATGKVREKSTGRGQR